jgi:hypothetical protein
MLVVLLGTALATRLHEMLPAKGINGGSFLSNLTNPLCLKLYIQTND